MPGRNRPMKLVEKFFENEHGFKGAYECETCHGVLIEMGDWGTCEGAEPSTEATPAPYCRLCDKQAPLSQQYRMALTTLGWACMSERGTNLDAGKLGFPSFSWLYIDCVLNMYLEAKFEYRGLPIRATLSDIRLAHSAADAHQSLFNDTLDGTSDLLDPSRLARELVDRCRRDLAIKHKDKEADRGR